jgi:hypothetical protein
MGAQSWPGIVDCDPYARGEDIDRPIDTIGLPTCIDGVLRDESQSLEHPCCIDLGIRNGWGDTQLPSEVFGFRQRFGNREGSLNKR